MGINFHRAIEEAFREIGLVDPFLPFKIGQEENSVWQNFGNKGSVLIEEAFFLYSLVRMTKPKYVVEGGTYCGIATIFLAEGLRDNGFGRITTLEHNEGTWKVAKVVFERLDYPEIDLQYGDIEKFTPNQVIDFLFLDTECKERVDQFWGLFPYFAAKSWVVFHDAGAIPDLDSIKYPYLHWKSIREIRVYHIQK